MMRCLGYAYAAIFKSRAALVAESLLVKYQLLILNRSRERAVIRNPLTRSLLETI